MNAREGLNSYQAVIDKDEQNTYKMISEMKDGIGLSKNFGESETQKEREEQASFLKPASQGSPKEEFYRDSNFEVFGESMQGVSDAEKGYVQEAYGSIILAHALQNGGEIDPSMASYIANQGRNVYDLSMQGKIGESAKVLGFGESEVALSNANNQGFGFRPILAGISMAASFREIGLRYIATPYNYTASDRGRLYVMSLRSPLAQGDYTAGETITHAKSGKNLSRFATEETYTFPVVPSTPVAIDDSTTTFGGELIRGNTEIWLNGIFLANDFGAENETGDTNVITKDVTISGSAYKITITINYKGANKGVIKIESPVSNLLPEGSVVSIKAERNIESEGSIGSIDMQFQEYDIKPNAFAISSGESIQSFYQAQRNLNNFNLIGEKMKAMQMIIARERDRYLLDLIERRYASEFAFDATASYVARVDILPEMASTISSMQQEIVKNLDDGSAASDNIGSATLIVGNRFARAITELKTKDSGGANIPAVKMRAYPYHLGKFSEDIDVICNPQYNEDTGYLVARSKNLANCGFYSGVAIPPIPIPHSPTIDRLKFERSLWGTDYVGITPKATGREYISKVVISNFA